MNMNSHYYYYEHECFCRVEFLMVPDEHGFHSEKFVRTTASTPLQVINTFSFACFLYPLSFSLITNYPYSPKAINQILLYQNLHCMLIYKHRTTILTCYYKLAILNQYPLFNHIFLFGVFVKCVQFSMLITLIKSQFRNLNLISQNGSATSKHPLLTCFIISLVY